MKSIIIFFLKRYFLFFNNISVLFQKYLHKYAINHELKQITNPIIYDIGAFDGTWSRRLNKLIPTAYTYKFDPNITISSNEINAECHNVLLYSSKCELQFYSDLTTGDSIFKEITKEYNEENILTLEAVTLDGYVSENGLEYPHFIKIDTQGSEIEILKGAKNTIKRNCFLVYIEVPISEYNEGAPHTTAVINFMNEIGFKPVQIFEQHIHDGILYQIDILFKKLC